MTPTLRPRTAKTCPTNGYAFSSSSSSLRKKKVLKQQKKLHVRISNDDLLDTILPFLTRRQLFHLQFVNRRLKRLIDSGMEKNQLRQKLCLTRLKFSDRKIFYPAVSIFKPSLELKHDQENELDKILAQKLPLYAGLTSRHFYAYVFNEGLGNTTHEIVFPTSLETVSELRLVRFWLHQLTRIHFEQGANDFLVMMKRNGLFNSAMIEALFPGQRRHFSFINFWLKLTDGMPLANLASSLKIAEVVIIDATNYDYHMESIFNFLRKCKHDCLPAGHRRLASIKGVRDIEFVQILKQLNFVQLNALSMIEFKYCTEVKLDGPLDRSLRLFRSKPKDTSVLEETYFLAENENPNRGSMDIAIKLTIDTNGGQRRLIEAHAIFSDGNEKQKSMLMLPNKYSFFY